MDNVYDAVIGSVGTLGFLVFVAYQFFLAATNPLIKAGSFAIFTIAAVLLIVRSISNQN